MKHSTEISGRVVRVQDRGPTINQGSHDEVWDLNPVSSSAAGRFQRFVQDLPTHLPHLSPAVAMLLCEISYDCILHEGDLIAMAQAASAPAHSTGTSRLSWTSTKEGYVHLEARCLSVRTKLMARRLLDHVDWSATLVELTAFLQSVYPEADASRRVSVLTQVLTDAKTWWYLQLPLCLYSHVTGVVRMPMLDATVLQRMRSEALPMTALQFPADMGLAEAHDQALDGLLDAPPVKASDIPKQTIKQIQSVFTVGTNSSGLRLATYLNAKELNTRLSLATDLLRSEGWIASVLLSWAIHLLTVGSVRKANPAISTLSAYISALIEPFARALIELKYPPSVYSQDDWVKLFEILRKQAVTGQYAAALASLHHWAVRTYGCDPMPDVIFQKVEATQVHANLIWPHEQQHALDLATTVSPDERVCQQVRVMLALGTGGLFRIGDLPALTTADLEVYDGVLWIHVDPGRGIHGGKSRAARRVVRIHDPALVGLIVKWRARRVLESELSTGRSILLFGDPHTPKSLYRMGHCVRIANDILRRATGDDRVSFHSLRHAGATTRAYPLLTQTQQPSAVSPLDELCHEMGHANRKTLWSTYFHLAEFALREAIDRIPALQNICSDEAAFWLNLTPAALRQRASRAASESSSTSALYLQWMHQRADAASESPYRPAERKPFDDLRPSSPCIHTPKDPIWVRQALVAIAEGYSSEAACLRLSCSTQDILSLCMAIQHALGSLPSARRNHSLPLLLSSADPDYALDWARQQITCQHMAFKIRKNSLLEILENYLQRHATTQVVIEGAMAWTKMRHRNVLSLQDPVATQVMLNLLRHAEIPADALLIRIQDHTTHHTERLLQDEAAIRELRSITLLSAGAPLRMERVAPRRGHPHRYLVMARSHLKSGVRASSASVRMNEFDGLFFSLCVCQSLSQGASSV